MKKFLYMLITVAAALFAAASCGTEGGEDTGDSTLTIETDAPVIRADGKSAAKITVKFGNKAITDGVTFYDGKTNKPVDIQDFTFTANEAGVYTFWAAYQTYHTEKLSITAINSPLPELPADPQPSNTVFSKKVFLIQFTGTDCGYCPNMMNDLDKLAAAIPEQYVLAACHTYNDSDPAFLEYSIDNALAIAGYPTVALNLNKKQKFSHGVYAQLKSAVEADYGYGISGIGISVSSLSDSGNLVAKARVKVAETGKYRVGAWLLEDGIYANQAGKGYMYHNNCVRDIYSKNTSLDYSGALHKIKAGESADQYFIAELDPSWKTDKLHLVVFVCTLNESGNYTVANVIDCPLGQSAEFNYAN